MSFAASYVCSEHKAISFSKQLQPSANDICIIPTFTFQRHLFNLFCVNENGPSLLLYIVRAVTCLYCFAGPSKALESPDTKVTGASQTRRVQTSAKWRLLVGYTNHFHFCSRSALLIHKNRFYKRLKSIFIKNTLSYLPNIVGLFSTPSASSSISQMSFTFTSGSQ